MPTISAMTATITVPTANLLMCFAYSCLSATSSVNRRPKGRKQSEPEDMEYYQVNDVEHHPDDEGVKKQRSLPYWMTITQIDA